MEADDLLKRKTELEAYLKELAQKGQFIQQELLVTRGRILEITKCLKEIQPEESGGDAPS